MVFRWTAPTLEQARPFLQATLVTPPPPLLSEQMPEITSGAASPLIAHLWCQSRTSFKWGWVGVARLSTSHAHLAAGALLLLLLPLPARAATTCTNSHKLTCESVNVQLYRFKWPAWSIAANAQFKRRAAKQDGQCDPATQAIHRWSIFMITQKHLVSKWLLQINIPETVEASLISQRMFRH